VTAKYAVAPTMTKFKKAKANKQKIPKSVICHYKDFGRFNAEKCMYINHEHWGNVERVWYGISLALAKHCLAKARIYPGKSLEDPMIGPRTSYLEPRDQYDDKSFHTVLRLVFANEGNQGDITREAVDIEVETAILNPDRYRALDGIAQDVREALVAKYVSETKCWLQEAQIRIPSDSPNQMMNAIPIYIQNLDDAEIHFYANSLIKFQNITEADHGEAAVTAATFDKNAIDANPLIGRVYSGKGHHPIIDGDLASMGDRTLDSYFGNVNANTGGITLLGHANTHTADDLGRIRFIPNAKEIYGNQTVQSGTIRMAAGAMKFHKTSFSIKKTFRQLADVVNLQPGSLREDMFNEAFGRHTMFGFTLEHKHGEDSIKIGYNRDTDIGCYIKHTQKVHPLKTNYVLDSGVVASTVVPTDHVHLPP
jgi:hypothetical protein